MNKVDLCVEKSYTTYQTKAYGEFILQCKANFDRINKLKE